MKLYTSIGLGSHAAVNPLLRGGATAAASGPILSTGLTHDVDRRPVS
jgi:hypothetical protein